MREDHQKERVRPLILPLWLQDKVLGENAPPKPDPGGRIEAGGEWR